MFHKVQLIVMAAKRHPLQRRGGQPTCMTRKLARSRRLMCEGGRKPLSWRRRPRGARNWPMRRAMLRWKSHAAARLGWYGCTCGTSTFSAQRCYSVGAARCQHHLAALTPATACGVPAPHSREFAVGSLSRPTQKQVRAVGFGPDSAVSFRFQ